MNKYLKLTSIVCMLCTLLTLSSASFAGWGSWGPKLTASDAGAVICSNGSHKAMLEWFGVVRGNSFGAWTETTNIASDVILVKVLTHSAAISGNNNNIINQRVIVPNDTHDVNVFSGQLSQLWQPFVTYTRCQIFR